MTQVESRRWSRLKRGGAGPALPGNGIQDDKRKHEAGGVRAVWQKDPVGTASGKDPGRQDCLGLRVRAEV